MKVRKNILFTFMIIWVHPVMVGGRPWGVGSSSKLYSKIEKSVVFQSEIPMTMLRTTTTTTKKKTPSTQLQQSTKMDSILSIRRGGGGEEGQRVDSNMILSSKIGLNTVLETLAMLGILAGTKTIAEKVATMPKIGGLPLIQWFGLFILSYASSFIGSVIEGSVNTASNQVLVPNVVPNSPEWYSRLKKPSWNPPGWVFPIMWLIVSKPTQMIAVSKILMTTTTSSSSLPWSALAIFCSHLALGNTWNKVFFGMQSIGHGVIIITTFYGLLLTSAYTLYQIKPLAGLFLLPTCAWVTVATALNWSIYLKNK